MFAACGYRYYFTAFLDESIIQRSILATERDSPPNAFSFRSPLLLRTSLTISLTGLTLIAASSQAAMATDWQYCLAPSHKEHKVYISTPFPSSGAWGNPDSALDRMLNQSGVRHDDVQCPRADDEPSIETMRQEAISFNHIAGNEIVNLNWKP
jgi:hypothetical protein